jgi:AcrR family transcriptional regulator
MRPKDDAKRTRLLEAAAPLFARKHQHEVTIDEIAAAAGVAKGTVYIHFKDKTALYQAVLEHTTGRVLAEIKQEAACHEAAADKLRAIARGCLAFVRAHPDAMLLWLRDQIRCMLESPHGVAPLSDQDQDALAVVSEILRSAARRGELRVGHPDLEAALFYGMIRSAHETPLPGFTVGSLADHVVDVFLNGLAVRGRGAEK